MKKIISFFFSISLLFFSSAISYGASTTSCYDSDAVLMLHANGSDASTTFTDSSSSAHTMTANGNAQIDTAQKQFGSASGLFDGTDDYVSAPDSADWQLGNDGGSSSFDGTGDYLSVPDSDDWQLGGVAGSSSFDGTDDYLSVPDSDDFSFGSGDFTIDLWVRFNALPTGAGDMTFVSQGDLGAVSQASFLYQVIESGGSYIIRFLYSTNGTTLTTLSVASGGLSINTWYHMAVVRNGNNFKFFKDGTQIGATQDMTGVTLHNSTQDLYIGIYDSNVSLLGDFDGYMDEVRISNTARWTSNFTPLTTPYTSDANTKLLLHMDRNYTDSSSSAHTVTANGNSAIANFSAFVYDFAIETWVKFNSSTGQQGFISQYVDVNNQWSFFFNTNVIRFQVFSSGSTLVNTGSTWTPSINTWYHVAAIRSGNDFKVFVDGIQNGSTHTTNITIPNFSASLTIGTEQSTNYLNGYLDEIRISNVARWTTTFSPETANYSNDANTKLLLHLTSNYTDSSSSAHTVTANGNAAINTFEYVFQGNFTIDLWVRFNTLPSASSGMCFVNQDDSSGGSVPTTRLFLYNESGTYILYFNQWNGSSYDFNFQTNWTPSINTWYHVAIVRSNYSLKAFIDGTQIGSTLAYTGKMRNWDGLLTLGVQKSHADLIYDLDGWIDEIRITKGTAIWTETFTRPSSEYVDCSSVGSEITNIVYCQ